MAPIVTSAEIGAQAAGGSGLSSQDHSGLGHGSGMLQVRRLLLDRAGGGIAWIGEQANRVPQAKGGRQLVPCQIGSLLDEGGEIDDMQRNVSP